MSDISEHPHGMQCITGLYAAFDPEVSDGVGFMTTPYSDDPETATWIFTADQGGDENEEGQPLACGMVSVEKATHLIRIWTWFPYQTFSLILIPPEDGEGWQDSL